MVEEKTNAFLLSNPIFENSIMNHFDLFFKKPINELFLLNENHTKEFHNSKIITNDYTINFVDFSTIENLNNNLEFYIVLQKDIRFETILEVFKVAQRNNKTVNVLLDEYDDQVLQLLPGDASFILNYCFLNSLFFEDLDQDVLSKKKPIILICGLSKNNQQLLFELSFYDKLKTIGVTFDAISYFLPETKKITECSHNNVSTINEINESIIRQIRKNQKTDSDLSIVSVPYDLASSSVLIFESMNRLISVAQPDYTICCVSRDHQILNNLEKLSLWFENKYNHTIDAVFVSRYSSNRLEYLGEQYPIHSFERIPSKLTDCLIVDGNDSKQMNKLIKSIISNLSYPPYVKLIK